ncbi:hypothetical protein [Azospirillum baldaniorum]|uniref:Lipoprotein n=1 Tax=Azospirillum baldaniorum TaxID=1064539 RepID=A0A9P1JP61_9PROT|nr:hypothetical protein [Azospirillum baldaniorum]CCC97124.1 exported protein of unknown function [Azospirillum baldaniorum]
MRSLKKDLQSAMSCALIFMVSGCAHNLAERVEEGSAASLMSFNAFLLVGIGGEAPGDVLGEASGLIYVSSNAVEIGFSEYDPLKKKANPDCASLTWTHGNFRIPLQNQQNEKYIIYRLPEGYYGFSDGYYVWLQRGKVTYVGDYKFLRFSEDCPQFHESNTRLFPKIVRIRRLDAAKNALKKYDLPEDSMVTANERVGENLYKFAICSP